MKEKSILINCKTCNKKVSSNAEICPHCGEKLNFTDEEIQNAEKVNKKNKLIISIAVAIIGLIMLAYSCMNGYNNAKNRVYNRLNQKSSSNTTYTITVKEN